MVKSSVLGVRAVISCCDIGLLLAFLNCMLSRFVKLLSELANDVCRFGLVLRENTIASRYLHTGNCHHEITAVIALPYLESCTRSTFHKYCLYRAWAWLSTGRGPTLTQLHRRVLSNSQDLKDISIEADKQKERERWKNSLGSFVKSWLV